MVQVKVKKWSNYVAQYAVESKPGPKIAFFWVKTWSKFFYFIFFVFQKSSSFCSENDIFQKNEKKRKKNTFLSQNLVQFCCATYLDQVLTQPWTRFWLNNFCNFWVFLPVLKCTKTTIFIVFSAKKENFKPTPKNWRTLFVNTIALFFFFAVLFFCIFAFLGFCCVRFFGGSFFERNEKTKKRQNSKQNNQKTKKEEGPQDANKKTT